MTTAAEKVSAAEEALRRFPDDNPRTSLLNSTYRDEFEAGAAWMAAQLAATPEWQNTLRNDGTYEYTTSGDCDGSNVQHWKRTPRQVIEAGPWVQA